MKNIIKFHKILLALLFTLFRLTVFCSGDGECFEPSSRKPQTNGFHFHKYRWVDKWESKYLEAKFLFEPFGVIAWNYFSQFSNRIYEWYFHCGWPTSKCAFLQAKFSYHSKCKELVIKKLIITWTIFYYFLNFSHAWLSSLDTLQKSSIIVP